MGLPALNIAVYLTLTLFHLRSLHFLLYIQPSHYFFMGSPKPCCIFNTHTIAEQAGGAPWDGLCSHCTYVSHLGMLILPASPALPLTPLESEGMLIRPHLPAVAALHVAPEWSRSDGSPPNPPPPSCHSLSLPSGLPSG